MVSARTSPFSATSWARTKRASSGTSNTNESSAAVLDAIVPACVIYMTLRHTFRLQLVKQTVTAVEQLADIVDMRDHYTFEHSRRVADFAVRIAREMALAPEQV